MPDDHFTEMIKRILKDLLSNSLSESVPPQEGLNTGRSRMPKSLLAPSAEDMKMRLLSIRKYLSPLEFASLKGISVDTVYRRIKAGMPADRDLNGRNLMIYPPQVAEWEHKFREARDPLMRSRPLSDTRGSNQKDSISDPKRQGNK